MKHRSYKISYSTTKNTCKLTFPVSSPCFFLNPQTTQPQRKISPSLLVPPSHLGSAPHNAWWLVPRAGTTRPSPRPLFPRPPWIHWGSAKRGGRGKWSSASAPAWTVPVTEAQVVVVNEPLVFWLGYLPKKLLGSGREAKYVGFCHVSLFWT